jgi:hypothetical protein
MVVSTDMPTRINLASGWSGATMIFTGRRCTILVKLPVAFSGGNGVNVVPVAAGTSTTAGQVYVVGVDADRARPLRGEAEKPPNSRRNPVRMSARHS